MLHLGVIDSLSQYLEAVSIVDEGSCDLDFICLLSMRGNVDGLEHIDPVPVTLELVVNAIVVQDSVEIFDDGHDFSFREDCLHAY